jgi:hypothetical protein
VDSTAAYQGSGNKVEVERQEVFSLSHQKNKCCCIPTSMTKNNNFRLLADVARLLRTKPHKIVYLLTSGQVPEPNMRLGNRRLFSAEDIEQLAAKLSNNKESTKK